MRTQLHKDAKEDIAVIELLGTVLSSFGTSFNVKLDRNELDIGQYHSVKILSTEVL